MLTSRTSSSTAALALGLVASISVGCTDTSTITPAHELSTQGVSDPSSALRVSLASVVNREALVDPLRALARHVASDAGAEALTLAPPPLVAQAGPHDWIGRFGGNGGPGGNFDWEIGSPAGGATQVFTLDTTFVQIQNSTQTAVQNVVNGNVDVRNLKIWPNGVLRIQGPNPCTIRASGKVAVHGKIDIKGGNAPGVSSFNTAHIPDPGAPGQGGGGRGGVGSPLTTASDPKGGDGFGAFQVPGAGGLGGESGWGTGGIGSRRPGGGGGGVFGHASLRRSPNPNGCPEQVAIGLDAEPGFDGSPQPPPAGLISGSAFGGAGQQPQGGAAGTSPFVDLNDLGGPKRRNDFFGTMITASGERIVGELLRPWAGAGGGGGGDSVQVPPSSPSFPQVPYDVNLIQKGSGGGGGGGSIAIYARGDIELAGFGSIDASGGTGGGGENTNGLNRVGGGSGGGSGGHIVLQTLSKIDMSQVVALGAAEYPSASIGGLFAVGGQGGQGAGGIGGAQVTGIPTTPLLDALPPDSYPNTGGGVSDGPCAFSTNVVGNAAPTIVVQCAGGDGGPGIIQLHVRSQADILAPVGVELFRVVKPPPIGSTPDNVNNPNAWDQLIPLNGRSPKVP